MKKSKLDKLEILHVAQIIKESNHLSQACRKLGYNPRKSGNQTTVKNFCNRNNIDISHWVPYIRGKLTDTQISDIKNIVILAKCSQEAAKQLCVGIGTLKRFCNKCQIDYSHWKRPTKKANHSWTGYEEISGTYYRSVKKGAEQRKLDFYISIEDMWQQFLVQKRKCALTNVLLFFAESHGKGQTASLDRIDSSKGYIKDNIQWIHKDINTMKWDFKQQTFIEWCKLVAINC